MPVTLDLMEYPTDAAAQAAYVSSDPNYTGDLCSGGVASASTIYSSSYTAAHAFDNNEGTRWSGITGDRNPCWIQYKFPSAKRICRVAFRPCGPPTCGDGSRVKDFQIRGSQNGTDWDILYSGTHGNNDNWETFTFNNSIAYLYVRIHITNSYSNRTGSIWEIEMMEIHLQCYSEDTIKQQGSYSLKGIARATDSLNDTLTRTVSPTIDLSDLTKIKFDIRASRTGSNIKIGIRDSGGTITEITPNVTSANTWQTVEWDISGVSNANKDAIDRIIVTVINANSDNTFYLDNMFANWWSKAFSDTLNLQDSFSRTWSAHRIFTETLHLTDTINIFRIFHRVFTETLVLSDTLKKKVGKVFTENINLSDVFSRRWNIYRTFTETINLADTISLFRQFHRVFTETLHLTDTFSKIWSIKRIFTEKITLTDKVKVAKVNLVNLLKKLIHLLDIKKW